ncbi:TonB-dependent receptor [Escherichia albertii]|nr:TonB-dependent receptor [Escherichia albertii]EFB7457567.1 TonB-dependent receptor [Escherichia albertii]EFO4719159.1 TonB-dependent receptor [Escherichia albertii]
MAYYFRRNHFLLISFTDSGYFLDRIILPSTNTEKGKGKWKIIIAPCLI